MNHGSILSESFYLLALQVTKRIFFLRICVYNECLLATGVIPSMHHRFFLPKVDLLPASSSILVNPLDASAAVSSFDITDEIYANIFLMYFLYGIGLFCYISKWPESLFPGKFDYWVNKFQYMYPLMLTLIVFESSNMARICGMACFYHISDFNLLI
jgi:hypothetical protein